MNKATVVTAVAAVAFIASLARVSTAPQAPPPAAQPSVAQGQLATMQQYCVGCHNDRAKVAGVSFEGVTLESIGQHADVFEKAVRKMRGRVMPPPGARHPGTAAIDSLVSYLEGSLDRADTQARVRDQVVLHRLNRKEYTNAVRDLLAVDFDATEILPASEFYYAEDYHQQYLAKNPGGYCGLGGTGVSCPVGVSNLHDDAHTS